MGVLTVFANFRIDSEERFLRMQDSFRSFCEANIEKWVINIRGPYKRQAAEFLKNNLGNNLILFELESRKGWFHDSRQMLENIQTEYVFFWIEDQLCVSGEGFFNQVVSEMKKHGAEYLLYTAYHHGATLRSFDCLPILDSDSIILVDYTIINHRKRLKFISDNKLICASFIISVCSILEVSLFTRLILKNDPLIKRSPKETPFDFEKNRSDIHWLPIKVAQTKKEFFAFIDDDHGGENHSLISRGLYPNRVSRDSMVEIRILRVSRYRTLLVRKLLRFLGIVESNIKYAIALLGSKDA